jgi:hypothetical protein
LIDASCCNDIIDETVATVNLTDQSNGQLILSNILSEAKATGWGNTYGYGKKSNWISNQIEKWYSKEHGGFLSW